MLIKKTLFEIIDKGPRKLRYYFYIIANRLLLFCHGISFGRNLIVYNRVYFDIADNASLIIGDNFYLTSGDCYNPLSRNIRASICLERPDTVVKIGNDTGMSSPCIWAKQSITIGDRVKIGGDCILMDSDAHNLDYRIRGNGELFGDTTVDVATAKCAPIVIEDDVLIGTRCIILKGVTIGARSIIAAGSVVTKSIQSDCIAGGNPCKVIKSLV